MKYIGDVKSYPNATDRAKFNRRSLELHINIHFKIHKEESLVYFCADTYLIGQNFITDAIAVTERHSQQAHSQLEIFK